MSLNLAHRFKDLELVNFINQFIRSHQIFHDCFEVIQTVFCCVE